MLTSNEIADPIATNISTPEDALTLGNRPNPKASRVTLLRLRRLAPQPGKNGLAHCPAQRPHGPIQEACRAAKQSQSTRKQAFCRTHPVLPFAPAPVAGIRFDTFATCSSRVRNVTGIGSSW